MSPARLLAQGTLKLLVGQGFSANAAQRFLVGKHKGYRREHILADYRWYSAINKSVAGVEDLNRWDNIPKDLMVETALKRDRLYRVYGYSDFYNPDTGLTDRVFTSFYSDQGANEQEWEQEFTEQYNQKHGEKYERTMLSFEVAYVEHNYGQAYNSWEAIREL